MSTPLHSEVDAPRSAGISPRLSSFESPCTPPTAARGDYLVPRGPLDVLRNVSRQMVACSDTHLVFDSLVRALVDHAGCATASAWMYITEAECEVCQRLGPTGVLRSGDAPSLHLCATAAADITGPAVEIDGPFHQRPLGFGLAGYVAETREALHVLNVAADPRTNDPRLQRFLAEHELVSFAGYPLVFRGELLGAIGALSRRDIPREVFEHLEIFAAQAAMAIKTSRMLGELERHKQRLQVENEYFQEQIRADHGFSEIVGGSPALRSVLRQVRQVAAADTTVLLLGETGTGKELIARAIHEASERKDRPLIKVNCAAISPSLVESELFGHEKGAFTGALQRRIGRFELAHKGTLFLDEVGELPLDVQVKLLRALPEQEFERVGGGTTIRTDARLVAATNRDLEAEVAAGRFRADLYYRLNVFPVRVPSLRERAGDIPMLVRHFLAQFQRKLAKPLTGVTEEGMARLQRYGWPGNIRELQNVLERACVLATRPVVDIPESLTSGGEPARAGQGAMSTLEEVERQHILRALGQTGSVIHGPKGAAVLLGINPNTLRSRMEKLGIDKRVGR
jgi:formate hydrogenlyase transcriptional activator